MDVVSVSLAVAVKNSTLRDFMQATLRIKKKYFDEISSGRKKTEYREVKTHYMRMFDNKSVKRLKLHYQSSRQLIVEVKRIDVIRESRATYLYAIRLGRIIKRTE